MAVVAYLSRLLGFAHNNGDANVLDCEGLEFKGLASSEVRGDILRRGATSWDRHAALTSGQVLLGNGTDLVSTALSGDVTVNGTGVTAIGTAKVTRAMTAKPRVGAITETVTRASMTDGGGTSGTKALTASIPAGARYLGTTLTAITGFTGDTSATLTIGDGSDVDRYNTGTPNVFVTAAQGVDAGAVSGTAWHTAAVTPTVTITSAADFTNVAAGSVDVTLFFLEPI